MKELFVEGNSLPEAYHAALEALKSSGEMADCADWNTKQLECSMTMAVCEPLKEPMISKLFIGGPRELEQYRQEILDGILDFEIAKGNWTYTYHDRMVNYPCGNKNLDQVEFVISELKRNPSSRRAVIIIRDVAVDAGNDDPACLQHIQFFIREGKLHCKVLFRSNDACKATFMNAFAFIMLQERIAKELGVEMGSYTHRANSFHCYEKDLDMLDGYVKRMTDAKDEYDVAFDYDEGWKEDMEACQAEIAEMAVKLKNN